MTTPPPGVLSVSGSGPSATSTSRVASVHARDPRQSHERSCGLGRGRGNHGGGLRRRTNYVDGQTRERVGDPAMRAERPGGTAAFFRRQVETPKLLREGGIGRQEGSPRRDQAGVQGNRQGKGPVRVRAQGGTQVV